MVASKTSFVVAAVVLSAASSVYAVPASFDAGSDLATRGFEDDEFQLAARFFDDDELEARDFEDEDLYARSYLEDEDELFARAEDKDGSATDPIRVKTPHRTNRHPHRHRKPDHKPPHFELETNYRGPGRHGPNRYSEGNKSASVGNTQKRSIEGSVVKAGLRGFRRVPNSRGHNSRPRRPHHHHRKPSNGNNHLNVQVDVPNTSDTSSNPQDVTRRDVDDMVIPQKRSIEGSVVKAGLRGFKRVPNSRGHNSRPRPPHHHHHRKPSNNHLNVQVDVPNTSDTSSNPQRRDVDDMVILARSLGLDDDYFLEERSFDDDVYEY